MQLPCDRCGRVLEFSGEPPSFCGYCGRPLGRAGQQETAATPASGGTADGTAAYGEPPEPAAGEAPAAVGGYRLGRRLGAGGMGAVYEAESAATGQRVALKLLAPAFAASPDAVDRFRQEGRLASSIAHPRCVFVLAADEDEGRPYIVMELMPGDTLKDLVEREGPLRQEEAIARILDAIEGLREAHRLGVVHRDVKPSNCFLDADGRVKVGDFGLSKSLGGGSHLTRTGAFLGTPLYASPEQIRGERVDAQSDVYAVAATLYYLLAGRAPFETADAAAAMARIVADPVPPLRGLRPDVSPALERVVLRGLERGRERRWRDLDEFRAALLPFAPGRLSIAGMGARFGAYLLDHVLFTIAVTAVNLLVLWWAGLFPRAGEFADPSRQALTSLAGAAFWVLGFAAMETTWGCTPGKWLLRLRVCSVGGTDPPRPARALWRSFLFYVLISLGSLAMLAAVLALGPIDPSTDPARVGELYVAALLLFYPIEAVGIVAMVSTMRARNGYRGLHEFLSGTRVVSLPAPPRQQTFPAYLGEAHARPEGVPERLGPFAVRGALRWSAGAGVLLAEDPGLGRRVFLWVRAPDAPALPQARRELGRATRLRWLAAGGEAGLRWDAFFAPAGGALPDLVARAGQLAWPVARPLLEQLVEELTAACADGSLPESLTAGQVWIHPDGRTQLLDAPLTEAAVEAPNGPGPKGAPGPACRAWVLLRQVAVLALEGAPRAANDQEPPLRAPVPGHAAPLLNRLLGADGDSEELRRFQDGLTATRQEPVEVTRPRRAAQLALAALGLSVGLFCCMLPSSVWAGFALALEDLMTVREQERALGELEDGARRAFLLGAFDRNPFVAANAARQLDEDVRLRDRLLRSLKQARRETRARRELLGWGTRWYTGWMGEQLDRQKAAAQRAARHRDAGRPQDVRAAAVSAADRPPHAEDFGWVFGFAVLIAVVFWPVAWMVWAALWRGGLSFRVMGIAVVRTDGRRASRLRCAYRVLLVWLPLAALLGASGGLEAWHWSAWTPEGPADHVWALWVSAGLFWSAAVLLVVYVALALQSPSRSLLDRLVGTCLVTR
jgi:hypothetical protein